MVILGLILLLLALAVITYMWFATAGMPAVDIDYGVLNVSLEPFWLFVAGGIALAAATSGLWMMAVGTRAKARKAKEVRELRRHAKEADRRAERAHDSSSLDQRPSTSATAPPSAGAPRDRGAAPSSTGSDAPILPRSPRGEGHSTSGTPGGRDDLNIDPPRH
jgi:type VI protein secretion system component VasK